MVELMGLAFGACAGALNLFITTHSPYVLSTLNLLLSAGQVLEKNGSHSIRAKLSKLVPEIESIRPDAIAAYYMDQEKCRSIMDEETGLIDGRGIDDVSGDIAEEFDAILDLE